MNEIKMLKKYMNPTSVDKEDLLTIYSLVELGLMEFINDRSMLIHNIVIKVARTTGIGVRLYKSKRKRLIPIIGKLFNH